MKSRRRPVKGSGPVSPNRHENTCSICGHPRRAEIERQFRDGASTWRLARHYSINRPAFYRHARTFNLFGRLGPNISSALAQLIEQYETLSVTAPPLVAILELCAGIDDPGRRVEPAESAHINELFDRMTAAQLDVYAKDSTLPEWFPCTTGGTPADGGE